MSRRLNHSADEVHTALPLIHSHDGAAVPQFPEMTLDDTRRYLVEMSEAWRALIIASGPPADATRRFS